MSNDAQYTLAKILKPLPNFEDIFQGANAEVGVAFFEGDNGRDDDAGEPGFDPDLLRYVDVPLGSRILVWIPQVYSPGDPPAQPVYRYRFKWRLRNVTDYRNRRIPFHVGRQFPGEDDTTDAANPQRLIIPAGTNTVIVNQAEETDALNPTQKENVRREALNVIASVIDDDYGAGGRTLLPTAAGGTTIGVDQQGIVDPAAFAPLTDIPTVPGFVPFFFDCMGDQLLIEAARNTAETAGATWDFSGVDAPFSNIYGTNVAGPVHDRFEGVGIYLLTGTA